MGCPKTSGIRLILTSKIKEKNLNNFEREKIPEYKSMTRLEFQISVSKKLLFEASLSFYIGIKNATANTNHKSSSSHDQVVVKKYTK